jgi:hypothetical protein
MDLMLDDFCSECAWGCFVCAHWGRPRFYLVPNRLLIGGKYEC